jgi:hypothetical protein
MESNIFNLMSVADNEGGVGGLLLANKAHNTKAIPAIIKQTKFMLRI